MQQNILHKVRTSDFFQFIVRAPSQKMCSQSGKISNFRRPPSPSLILLRPQNQPAIPSTPCIFKRPLPPPRDLPQAADFLKFPTRDTQFVLIHSRKFHYKTRYTTHASLDHASRLAKGRLGARKLLKNNRKPQTCGKWGGVQAPGKIF